MTRSASILHLGSELNTFLFAPIGKDRNGIVLSVLSALARSNVDPWQKAAELARLPAKTATESLASLIAALPDGPSVHGDTGTIAADLVTLLPRQANSHIPLRETLLGAGATTNSRVVGYVILMAFLLGAQYIAASVMESRQPPPQIDSARAPASSTISSQTQPPRFGQ